MTQERQDGTTLPPAIRRLWGLESQKAPRTGLSVERIVQAAMEVADAEGLGAVSMARVAKQLGFTTMALYRHVEGKEELLELMRDAGAHPPEAITAEGDWRATLEGWAWAMRRLIYSRPWYVDLGISGIPTGPRQLEWVEVGLQALRDTPLAGDERFNVVVLLAGYVRGDAQLARELERGLARSGRQWHEAEWDWSRNLAVLLDAERFPELSKLAAAGTLAPAASPEEVDPDADFAFGLARYLDGVELLIRRRAAGEG